MSLSSVLKQAGHECVMFDQANPDTPNEIIIDEIQRQQPVLVGLSFLSTTSYPYARSWRGKFVPPTRRSSSPLAECLLR
jgi:B12 binding domain.